MLRCLSPLAGLLVVACAGQPPAPVEERAAAREVREPAAAESRGLQVYPMRNPAVAELTDAARQAEREGDLERATGLLERALRIAPRDPELLQHMAEVQLDRDHWNRAADYAARSWELGPQVGEICQRNWRTLALARERQQQHAAARRARERLADCQVETPPRS